MATPATRTPIKLARGSYSNLYASIDDLQEGEIVYAEDQNQLYVKEGSQLIDVTGDGGGGSGSTNLSYTTSGAGLSLVSSSGSNTDLPAATTDAWGLMTDEDKTNLDANTAKVTNATHTGDVTGSGALTIADDAVTYAKMQNVSATDRVLGRDSSGAGVVEEITPANLRTMINVEDGATADQSNAEIRAAVEAASDSNVFTDDDHSKLNGIEASADVTDSTNVNSAGAVMNSDLDGKGELLVGDGSGDPSALAVGTNNYVLTADSGEATGVKWAAAAPEGTAVLSTGETGTTKFLRVDGDGSCSWQVPPDTNTQVNIDDTPVNGVTDEAISSNWAYDHNAATGNSAHVPAAGSSGQFLKHDGTWGTPPDTNTTYSVVDSSANGLAPQLPGSHGGKFLKADGTWEVPPDTNTTYSVQDGQLSQNNFTDADHTKLNGIEASADVTDATNVAAAGAAMLTGAAFTGHITLADDIYAKFGASEDLIIGHSSADNYSYIHEANTTGSLRIKAEDLLLEDTSGDNYLFAKHDEGVLIYYDNAIKFQTKTNGVEITGTIDISGAIDENVFAITDGNAAIDPDNGTIQTWTLGANRTASDSVTAGQSVLLMITAGAHTLTWPTITWAGGSAPTLSTSSTTAIEIWKVGSTLYGANVGDV